MGKILLALMLVLSSGCSKSTGGGKVGEPEIPKKDNTRPAGKISGKAVDALIIGGTLSVYDWSKGEKGEFLGSATTNDAGGYELSIVSPDATVYLELVGGYYIEEASGERVDLDANQSLRAIAFYVSGNPLSVMVTPWTNIGVGWTEWRIKNENINSLDAFSGYLSAMTAVVGVDVNATIPADITQENTSLDLTDELAYGIQLAAASSITKWANDEHSYGGHSVFTSIKLSQTMYADIKADGVLNGSGFKVLANGELTDQVVSYSLGSIPLNTEFYRRQLALEMIKVVSSDYNKSLITKESILGNAQKFAGSTHPIWGSELTKKIDITGPAINWGISVGTTIHGQYIIPSTVTDILGVESVTFLINGEEQETRRNPTDASFVVDTTNYNDTITLTLEAIDTIENYSTSTIELKVDNHGPSLNVDKSNLITNLSEFRLRGTAEDINNAGLVVRVGGKDAVMGSGGKWEAIVQLDNEITTVSVTATDSLGNISEESVYIKKDVKAPDITPIFSEARFYGADNIIKKDELKNSDGHIYFDMDNLSLNGLEQTLPSLDQNLIPYVGIITSDPGDVSTSDSDLVVKYSVTKNGVDSNIWKPLSPTELLDGGAGYILPFATEFLGQNLANAALDDLIYILIRSTDSVGNSSDFKYQFKVYINFPKLHVNTYPWAKVVAYEYSNGNIGGIAGSCSANELGYCPIAISSGPSDLQLRVSGGEYLEPSISENSSNGLTVSYVHFLGSDIKIFINPMSAIYASMVDLKSSIDAGVEEFIGVYGFHPYTTMSIPFSDDADMSDGVKLGLQLAGISGFASDNDRSSGDVTSLIASDYKSDGILDGVAVVQVEPETLALNGYKISANTYRSEITRIALDSIRHTNGPIKSAFAYLEGISKKAGGIFGVQPIDIIILDEVAPVIELIAPELWAKTVKIEFNITDESSLSYTSISINNDLVQAFGTVTHGSINFDSALLADGEYDLSASSADEYENSAEKTIKFRVDNTPPTLTINSPTLVNSIDYIASGTVNDKSNVEVLVDGVGATVENGSWSLPVRLTALSSVLKVVAVDGAGNEASSVIRVAYDSLRPLIDITESSGDIWLLSGRPFYLSSITSNDQYPLYIPIDLTSLGDTGWGQADIDIAGYMYLSPRLRDQEGDGKTPFDELYFETRYLQDGVVKRDWSEWDKSRTVIPFVTETLSPGWETLGSDVVHTLEMRLRDNAGNWSNTVDWSFRAHVVTDFTPPTLTVDGTFTKYSKGDGVSASCTAGELDATSSQLNPICIDATKASLDGREVTQNLTNEGYMSVKVNVFDPFGDGSFSQPENVSVQYQYLKNGEIVKDWAAAPRQEESTVVYLPLVREYLGDNFFITSKDDSHVINFLATDEEGNTGEASFNLRLDVLTPELEIQSVAIDDSVFKAEFDRRSTLNLNQTDVKYSFENESNTPYRIRFSSPEHRAVHKWEVAQRYNSYRLVTQEQWQIKTCTNCTTRGWVPSSLDAMWSGNWQDVTNLWDGYHNKFSVTTIYGEYINNTNNPLSPAPSVWDNYMPDGLCNKSELVAVGGKTTDDDSADFACSATLKGGSYVFDSRIQRRFVYNYVNEDGYPINDIQSKQEELSFSENTIKVFSIKPDTQIFPVDGWFSIPEKTKILVVNTIKLPAIANKTDSRVLLNDSTVPFNSTAELDKSLDYSIQTTLSMDRAIDAVGAVSVSSQTIGDGVMKFSVSR